TIQYIRPQVSTICIGQACSMGALLLAAGAKGKRYALQNSRIMIHQALGGFQGQASDIEIHAKEMLQVRERLNQILAHHTGKPLNTVAKATDGGYFMSADAAKTYGLVDAVLQHRPDAKKDKK